jgi:hypothetical protein
LKYEKIAKAMLWNNEFVYLHYPKAAGKSLARAFLQAWSRPVQGIVSKGQLRELADLVNEGVHLRGDGGHQNAMVARRILRECAQDIHAMRAVFVSIRNPYDMIYSNYCFLRQHYPTMQGNQHAALAARSSFGEFVLKYPAAPFERWCCLDGVELRNLKLVRVENMQDDFNRYAAEFDFQPVSMPHLNRSDRDPDYLRKITPELEGVIYSKYRFMFDKGWYPRLSLS